MEKGKQRKKLSLYFKTLAFALGFTQLATCAINFEHKHNEKQIEIENDIEEIEEDEVAPSFEKLNIKPLLDYEGDSLIEALDLCGIDSSFANRKKIAEMLGIKNYIGSPLQDAKILNILRDGKKPDLIIIPSIKDLIEKEKNKEKDNIDKEDNSKKQEEKENKDDTDNKQDDKNKNDSNGKQDDNSKNDDNNKDDDSDNKNDKPIINHKHKFIKWKFYDNEKEVSNCSDCGEQTYRKHLLEFISKKTYIKNNNNTHKVVENINCVSCDGTITKEYDELCNYSDWKYNFESKKEEKECELCESKIEKEHFHTQAPSNLKYQLDKTNNDGTHKLKAVYNCDICKEPITLVKDANCNLGSWKYNSNTKLEERSCDVCNYKETKEHKHQQAPSNLKYQLDKTNNDGTHKLKAVYNCDICKEPITLVKDANCNLGNWKYNSNTKLEERSCDVCNYKETKEHKHQQAPSNLNYVFDKTNNDGTHKLKATYQCNICSGTITLYKDENCSYGIWTENNGFTCKHTCNICNYSENKNHNFNKVAGSATPNPTLGKHNVTEKCSDCSYEKQTEENCVSDGNRYIHKDGNIVTEREDCSICKDVCIEGAHNHTYGGYVPVDDTNHKRDCACGYENVEGHSYSEWSVTADGKNSRSCGTCGHTQSYEHSCVHKNSREFPSDKTGEYCYEDVTRCELGCSYEQRNKIGHSYSTQSNFFGEVHTCTTCGYTYEVVYDLSSLIPSDEPTQTNEEQNSEEEVKVLVKE